MDTNQQLIFTAITRFGTVVFIIYAVAVLLNVFRYVMKLAAYYEARAHALMLTKELGKDGTDALHKYAEILAAEKVDFGKEPSTPAENLIDLLKASKDIAITVTKGKGSG